MVMMKRITASGKVVLMRTPTVVPNRVMGIRIKTKL